MNLRPQKWHTNLDAIFFAYCKSTQPLRYSDTAAAWVWIVRKKIVGLIMAVSDAEHQVSQTIGKYG